MIARWKMSNDEADLLLFLDKWLDIRTLTRDELLDAMLLNKEFTKAKIVNLMVAQGRIEDCQYFADFVPPVFPVNGKDVMERYPHVKPGPHLGQLLEYMKVRWTIGRFEETRDELLDSVF